MSKMRGLFLVLMLASGAARAAPAPEAVALVADVEGAVLATHPGDAPAVVDLFTSLPPGAALTVPDGARVNLLYYASGRTFRFSGPDSVTLGKDAPASLSGAESDSAPARSATGLTADDVRQLVLASLDVRGTGVRKRLQLRSPVGTVVTQADPVFTWAALEPGARYRFALRDEGGRVLWETQTEATRLQLPAGTELAAGEVYGWLVETRGASGKAFSATAEFRVADGAQREQLERFRSELGQGDAADRLLYALVLHKLGMEQESAVALQALARERPQSAQLQRVSAHAAQALSAP